MKPYKSLILIVIPLYFLLPSTGHAQVRVELCSAIDGSGSMSGSDFTLQKQGLAAAITDPSIVPQDGTVAISVVQFSTTALVEVARTVIDSAAAANGVATAINNINQLGGSTAIGDAIATCVGTLTRDPSLKSTIDVSTDGGSNTGTPPETAADNAIAAGVDAINALGVGVGVTQASLELFVRPLPAKQAPPYIDGFWLIVSDFNQFAAVVKEKIKAEVQPPTGGVPVPAVSPLGLVILTGLLGLIGVGMRRRKG